MRQFHKVAYCGQLYQMSCLNQGKYQQCNYQWLFYISIAGVKLLTNCNKAMSNEWIIIKSNWLKYKRLYITTTTTKFLYITSYV